MGLATRIRLKKTGQAAALFFASATAAIVLTNLA
jgi:hypothetical protein